MLQLLKISLRHRPSNQPESALLLAETAAPLDRVPPRGARRQGRAGAADHRLPEPWPCDVRDRDADRRHGEAHARCRAGDDRPPAPEEFVAAQIGRLTEALGVAYGAMSEKNLRAVELVVRIVRQLDRYHGLVANERRPVRVAAPATIEDAGLSRGSNGPTIAEQVTERARFAPEKSANLEVSAEAPAADVPGATERGRSTLDARERCRKPLKMQHPRPRTALLGRSPRRRGLGRRGRRRSMTAPRRRLYRRRTFFRSHSRPPLPAPASP